MSPVLKFTQIIQKQDTQRSALNSVVRFYINKLYIHKYIIWNTYSSNWNAICIGFWTGTQKSTL